MNARANPDDAHRATQENLPWLLSGRLGGEDRALAEAHLADCAACRADLVTLRRLRAAAELPDPPCDPDAALTKLFDRIDAPVVGRPPAAANDPRWLRRAALAQCGVIVLLAALLIWRGDASDAYRGLGAAPAVQGQAVVVFRPETSERELRRIVQASGARIVDGPTVTDAWVLALPQEDAAELLARLRAEPAVLLAEPLGAEGRP
ncbi:S8 family serine peptidase [Massilia suwonensis]|uniref:Zf-HC2 domain-containing protein n=1 Tax=Massilia suwonensis TaxID=648895 RepID=A0ABW0MPT9_9BURK